MVLPLNSQFGPATGWTVQNGDGGNLSLVGSAGEIGAVLENLYTNDFLAQNLQVEDVQLGTVTPSLTLGTAYGARMYVPGVTTAKGAVLVNTAAVTPTHGWLYLLNASGALIAQTADQTSSAFTQTAGTIAAIPWTSSTTVPAGWYYLVAVQVGGTAAKLAGAMTPGSILNYNLVAPASGKPADQTSYRFASLATGVTAAGLTTPVTMSAMGADNTVQPFVALL